MKCTTMLACLAATVTFASLAAPQEDDIDVRIIKYNELGKLALDKRGKVIVFDFWDLG